MLGRIAVDGWIGPADDALAAFLVCSSWNMQLGRSSAVL